jgi:hypothetical protein
MKSNLIRLAAVPAVMLLSIFSAGCASSCGTSSMQGTYSDPMGSVILELKSGGKASFTFMGEVADCTYGSASSQVTVKCGGDAGTTVFTVHDDGSLTGPPGSFMPALRKQK